MTSISTQTTQYRYNAIAFDLLTALLDSWSLWNAVAGDDTAGMNWRKKYLELTYAAGPYRAYEEIITEAALQVGLSGKSAAMLLERWDELQPWPEAPTVLQCLASQLPLAVVTNCSDALAERAVARVGVPFAVIVTAQRAGYYKPMPQPYRMALAELGIEAPRVLFVAGSPFDIPGAATVGMPVFWHNRMSLPLPVGEITGPVAVETSLSPLLAFIGHIGA